MALSLAIDQTNGLSLPDGRVAGINATTQGLRAAGFPADPYAGNRLASIDETDSSVWSDNCVPGWYYISGAVQEDEPTTDVYQCQVEFHKLCDQFQAWVADLDRLAPGQLASKVAFGHNALRSAMGAAYLVATNQVNGATYTLTARRQWANSMRMGAADVTSALEFYANFSATMDYPDGWHAWVNPTAPTTRLSLSSTVQFTPASSVDPGTRDLTDHSWIDDIA